MQALKRSWTVSEEKKKRCLDIKTLSDIDTVFGIKDGDVLVAGKSSMIFRLFIFWPILGFEGGIYS